MHHHHPMMHSEENTVIFLTSCHHILSLPCIFFSSFDIYLSTGNQIAIIIIILNRSTRDFRWEKKNASHISWSWYISIIFYDGTLHNIGFTSQTYRYAHTRTHVDKQAKMHPSLLPQSTYHGHRPSHAQTTTKTTNYPTNRKNGCMYFYPFYATSA